MAKRPKRQSVLEIALVENWKVSASLAAGMLLVIFVVIPAITNPYLKIIALVLRPIGLILAAAFGLIAFIKCVAQWKSRRANGSGGRQAGYKPLPKGWSATAMRAMEENRHPSIVKRSVTPLHDRPDTWTLEFLQCIEWKKFEELSTAYYSEKGIRAEATTLGADGGIDIKLYQGDSNIPTSIVQCKAWNTRLVGVKEVREFLGVMSHEKIEKGFYMASSGYTAEAIAFAKTNRITLITGEMLLMMIKRLPDVTQKKLMALASAGDYMTPSCPSCGTKMIKRSSRRGDFWGCKNYPRCRRILHVRHA